ncbi:MAG: hypothetical protein H6981_07225 [Gammaproteobacteria bacterium]|nr:hypothetical protein [Gammaproteobacteria bacterium]
MTQSPLFALTDLADPAPKPETTRSVSLATVDTDQRTALGARLQTCADVIGQIRHGETIHYASMGDWSTHDLVFHLLDQIGPAELHLATWSMTPDPIAQLIRMMDEGRLTAVHALLDWRIKVRGPEVLAMAKHRLARVAVASCHAKVTVLRNADWRIAIVGSANYTRNPRIEAGIITTAPAVAEFHQAWIDAEIRGGKPFEGAA